MAAICVAAAWAALIFAGHTHLGAHSSTPIMTDMPYMAGMTKTAGTAAVSQHHMARIMAYFTELCWWAVMTVAMMGPAAIPSLLYVEHNTLRWRRGRAILLFTAAWLILWLAFGAAITLLPTYFPAVKSWVTFAGALMLAALWQASSGKRRALNDCHRGLPLMLRGRPATLGVLKFGIYNSRACIRSCWAMMAALTLVPAAHLTAMVVCTTAIIAERFTQRPHRITRVIATALAATALLAGAAALIA